MDMLGDEATAELTAMVSEYLGPDGAGFFVCEEVHCQLHFATQTAGSDLQRAGKKSFRVSCCVKPDLHPSDLAVSSDPVQARKSGLEPQYSLGLRRLARLSDLRMRCER